MKKLLFLSILIIVACSFTGCQRYPWLTYYIVVEDKNGNNLLTDSAEAGKINISDVWFERHGEMVNDTSIVLDTHIKDEVDTAGTCYASYQKGYTPEHIMVDASASIGVKLEECPKLIAHWPDGSVDTLQIDNANGTMSDPEYYVNGKKVKCRGEHMLVIIK